MNPMSFLRLCALRYEEMPLPDRERHWRMAYDIIQRVEMVVSDHQCYAAENALRLNLRDYDTRALYHLVNKHGWVRSIYLPDRGDFNFCVKVVMPEYPVKEKFPRVKPEEDVVVSRQGDVHDV